MVLGSLEVQPPQAVPLPSVHLDLQQQTPGVGLDQHRRPIVKAAQLGQRGLGPVLKALGVYPVQARLGRQAQPLDQASPVQP